MTDRELMSKAKQASLNAYVPYSRFAVGAAIECTDGTVFTGCNVENASYPCGTCAEAGAISAMIAGGETKISRILIIADTKQILPCGNCLQKILEFGDENTLIISADLSGNVKIYKLYELLPNFFKAGDMNNAE